jgi:DNA invertase Pin-like site-specific DNA recombinase
MRAAPQTPKAIGYIRVSSESQAESGLGLDAQRRAIAAAANRLEVPLVGTFQDAGLSGSLAVEARPGLVDALAALGRGDTLLIAKRDRIARDVLTAAMVERLVARKGAKIVSAAGEGTESDDPTAILMRRIVDAFSEYERLLIGARTKAALRSKRAQGKRAGNVPYGFRLASDGQTLLTADAERAVLAVIQECHAARYSLREIAGELNRRGLRTRQGSPWRHQYVANLVATA